MDKFTFPDVPNFHKGNDIPDSHRIDENNAVESLIKVFSNWKERRESYPGWVILPNQNRKDLFSNTINYINPILRCHHLLEKPNDILLIFELYWRLNKCMVPLSIQEVETIEKLLNRYEPFEDITNIYLQKNSTSKPFLKSEFWDKIDKAYIFLQSILISDSRRDLEFDKFNKRKEIFEILKNQYSDITDFLFYENCLYNLSIFNENELVKLINDWLAVKDSNLLYKARKVSILTELGDYVKAEDLGKNILNEIRQNYINNEIDYHLMSIEGFLMILLNIINYKEDWQKNKYRFETLSKYKCNPWDDIMTLQKELDVPLKLNRPKTERKKTFDIDRITIIEHFGENITIEKLLPAISYLRLFEDSCLPISGRVNIGREYIFKASKQIRIFFPSWGLTNVLRSNFNNTDKLDNFIDRIYIAVINENTYRLFVNLFFPKFVNTTNNLIYEKEIQKLTFNKKSFLALSDLISKLSLRFDKNQKDDLFKVLIEFYNSQLIRNSDELKTAFDKVLERLLETMTYSELINILPKLVQLPIGNEKGFEIKLKRQWIDPFHYFFFDNEFKFKLDFRLSDNEFKRLRSCALDDKTRDASLLRLFKLYRINCLNNKQTNVFIKSLKSKLDEFGLPECRSLYKQAFIYLPAKASISENIKNKFLKNEIPLVARREIENGKIKSRTYSSGDSTEMYLRELKEVSQPLFKNRIDKTANYIRWSEKEVLILLEKIINWWNSEKNDLKTDLDENGIISSLSNILFDCFSYLDEIFSRVIIPNLGKFQESIYSKIRSLLNELEKKNISLMSSEVILLMYNNEGRNSISNSIFDSLLSLDKEKIKKSCDAIFLWILYTHRKKIEKSPIDFIPIMLNYLLSRREPGLRYCLLTINKIVHNAPKIFTKSHYEQIIKANEFLFEDLKYPDESLLYSRENDLSYIEYADIPQYREICSILAYNLNKYYKYNGLKTPKILEIWKKSAIQDPLPEVRYYWANSSI